MGLNSCCEQLVPKEERKHYSWSLPCPHLRSTNYLLINLNPIWRQNTQQVSPREVEGIAKELLKYYGNSLTVP